MNARWRLDSKAPSLANEIRRAMPAQQERAARAACKGVVHAVDLVAEDDVRAALQELGEAIPHDPTLPICLTALSERFDNEYFRLDGEGDEARRAEALRQFARARAVATLAFALSDDRSQFHEAIYEAMAALVDEPGKVARAVGAVLREAPQN